MKRFIILAILPFIFYYIFKKKKHKYWDNQPVSKDLNAFDGIITTNIPETIKLKKGYSIKLLDKTYLSLIGEFLSSHFVKGYIYNLDYITWTLSLPYMIERNKIGLYHNNKMISFICAKPYIIKIKNKVVNLHYIDFLSVHKTMRNKNLAPIVISYAAKLCYTGEYTSYLFKIELKPLPFRYIAKCKYYYFDVLMNNYISYKLKEGYIFEELKLEDMDEAKQFFINSQDKYKLGFYPDKNQFIYLFSKINRINYSYVIKTNNKIIGLCNFNIHTFKPYNIIENISELTTIELIPDMNITICDFMKLIMDECKKMKYRYINLTNTGQNRVIIDRLGYTHTLDYYLHMYNYHIRELLQNYEIGYNWI